MCIRDSNIYCLYEIKKYNILYISVWRHRVHHVLPSNTSPPSLLFLSLKIQYYTLTSDSLSTFLCLHVCPTLSRAPFQFVDTSHLRYLSLPSRVSCFQVVLVNVLLVHLSSLHLRYRPANLPLGFSYLTFDFHYLIHFCHVSQPFISPHFL